MMAAQIFNQTEGNEIVIIYAALTTGVAWKFSKLSDKLVEIDLKDYSIETNPEQLIGILSTMMAQKA